MHNIAHVGGPRYWGDFGYASSSTMLSFDKLRTYIFFSPFIETTVCVCLVSFSRYSMLFVAHSKLFLPHVYLVPPLCMTTLGFHIGLWHQKTRMFCCLMPHLAILIEHHSTVTDKQRDIHR